MLSGIIQGIHFSVKHQVGERKTSNISIPLFNVYLVLEMNHIMLLTFQSKAAPNTPSFVHYKQC